MTEDQPRRTGMRLKPSYCDQLNMLAVGRKRTATDLLNEAVGKYLEEQGVVCIQPLKKKRAKASA